jgi:hypothetical protein
VGAAKRIKCIMSGAKTEQPRATTYPGFLLGLNQQPVAKRRHLHACRCMTPQMLMH